MTVSEANAVVCVNAFEYWRLGVFILFPFITQLSLGLDRTCLSSWLSCPAQPAA